MSLLVYAVGIHKIFNKTDFPAISSLKDSNKSESIIVIQCDTDDAAIFGEDYTEGASYIWALGQLIGGPHENIINDDIVSLTKTWSSQKISSELTGIYKFVGSTYDYSSLPSSDLFEILNKVPDIADDTAIFVSIAPIWQNEATKLISGLKIKFFPGNANTKQVWFRNDENWARNNSTNLSINGLTLADIGYSVDVTTFGQGVIEANITLDSYITLDSSSTIVMDVLTWGSEVLSTGEIRNNEYIVNNPITFKFIELESGDVYNTIKNDMNYAWTGAEWDALGPSLSGDNILVGGAGKYKDNTIEEAINDKQDTLSAGDGIDISTDNIISIHSDNEYIKYYATLADYNADTTRSEDVCVSYILDIDKVIFEHDGYDPEN